MLKVFFSGSFLNLTLLNNQFSFEDKLRYTPSEVSTIRQSRKQCYISKGARVQKKEQCVNFAEQWRNY